jgi:hypothetical protein
MMSVMITESSEITAGSKVENFDHWHLHMDLDELGPPDLNSKASVEQQKNSDSYTYHAGFFFPWTCPALMNRLCRDQQLLLWKSSQASSWSRTGHLVREKV